MPKLPVEYLGDGFFYPSQVISAPRRDSIGFLYLPVDDLPDAFQYFRARVEEREFVLVTCAEEAEREKLVRAACEHFTPACCEFVAFDGTDSARVTCGDQAVSSQLAAAVAVVQYVAAWSEAAQIRVAIERGALFSVAVEYDGTKYWAEVSS